MSDSPYAEALADRYDPVGEAMRQAYAPEPTAAHLPAVVETAPAVITPTVLPAVEQRRGVDLLSVRLIAAGVCSAGIGAGVDLAGQGIRAAGPYLWALAGCLLALAGLVALIRGHAAPTGSGNTTVTITGGKNRIGSIG